MKFITDILRANDILVPRNAQKKKAILIEYVLTRCPEEIHNIFIAITQTSPSNDVGQSEDIEGEIDAEMERMGVNPQPHEGRTEKEELRAEISSLTLKYLKETLQEMVQDQTWEAFLHKKDLVEWIVNHTPDNVHSTLRRAAKEKRTSKRTHQQMNDEADHFMQLPTAAERNVLYQTFYQSTSNAALQRKVCVVCARGVYVCDEVVHTRLWSEVKNTHRLKPLHPHPDHYLVDGALLEPEGVVGHDPEMTINICKTCDDSLSKSATNKPPRLSLANGMWVGPIPSELARLTLPE